MSEPTATPVHNDVLMDFDVGHRRVLLFQPFFVLPLAAPEQRQLPECRVSETKHAPQEDDLRLESAGWHTSYDIDLKLLSSIHQRLVNTFILLNVNVIGSRSNRESDRNSNATPSSILRETHPSGANLSSAPKLRSTQVYSSI